MIDPKMGDDMGGNHSECSCDVCRRYRAISTAMLLSGILLAAALAFFAR